MHPCERFSSHVPVHFFPCPFLLRFFSIVFLKREESFIKGIFDINADCAPSGFRVKRGTACATFRLRWRQAEYPVQKGHILCPFWSPAAAGRTPGSIWSQAVTELGNSFTLSPSSPPYFNYYTVKENNMTTTWRDLLYPAEWGFRFFIAAMLVALFSQFATMGFVLFFYLMIIGCAVCLILQLRILILVMTRKIHLPD